MAPKCRNRCHTPTSLAELLRTRAPERIVLEATGGYESVIAAALASEQLPVVVVNPRQVRDFDRATGQLAKTDQLDAHVLAHFAAAIQPEVRPLPDATTRALSALVARRRQLQDMLTACFLLGGVRRDSDGDIANRCFRGVRSLQ
jgi:transposase